jgi:D-proline reductase (dithiol) PrdB
LPRLEDLDEESREFLGNFQCRSAGELPWTPLRKPLSDCKVALVTTSGLISRKDEPFELTNPNGDASFRMVPVDTDPGELTFSHVSTNWDRSGFAIDINVVLPLDRLRELASDGVIGSIADHFFSFMGAIFQFDRLIGESAPRASRLLKQAEVDIVLLVPT